MIPKYPIAIYEKVQLMHESWHQSQWLERLQVKTLFYQILLSTYQQLCSQERYVKQTGLVSQIKAYVEEHYTELIRLESLAERLNYSVSHISAVFKSETNYSLVEYVMQLRMKKTVALLKSTNVPLKEIAASVGYTDVHYFNRLFKRHLGISPGRYRKLVLDRGMLADAPQNIIESSIDEKTLQRYIDSYNHYRYEEGGKFQMARKNKSNFAAALLLCLTLLLGACASGANTNSGPKGI
ncbi:helix-turn-helix transcriptional regulator [Lysinibacillus sp. FSL K6-0102]|uniref:helix-turn-helix transcriptional regulator n=1 Tax=Lysinibacillus sp. FSL K6-0102 TaxID=2975290 RepID=UPI0030F4D356